VAAPNPRSESRKPARYDAAFERHTPLLPQGPSLQSGLFCPGPSTLSRPHPPHSQARRAFPAVPVMCDAFAVRERLGDPRVVPAFAARSFLTCRPLCPRSARRLPVPRCTLHRRQWPSPTYLRLGALDTPAIRFGRGYYSGSPGSLAAIHLRCGPVRLLALLADRTGTRAYPRTKPTRNFSVCAFRQVGRPSRRQIWLRCSLGRLHRGDFHPLETSASIAARYVEYPPSSLVAAGTPRDATARSKFQSVVVLTRNLRYRKAGLLTDALIAGHRPVRAETCSRRVASAHSQFSRQVGSRVSGAGPWQQGHEGDGSPQGLRQ